ncbi:Actin monomer binding protein [Pyrenophora tritici-repentis]|nr:Actin monomer binding protein [Pyrenophora tritici-repentis]
MICKEIGEVTDERSWEERDAEQRSKDAVANDAGEQRVDGSARNGQKSLIDAGYKRNKCRLCDRRMKNNISPEALEALAQLHTPSTAVQIVLYSQSYLIQSNTNLFKSVNTSTETLELRYIKNLAIADVAATLPAETPSFTLYRHAITRIVYFIFHSPDTASVQERMMHTMAIPGLINIHA